MRLTWPLTGRSEEMRLIEAALSDEGSSGIVICGAAGVGKSRLAREAVDASASRGCVTHWAVGSSCAEALPLGAFAAWVQSDAATTVQLVRGVIDSLTAAAPGQAVVLGIDDVHRLDELSTFVVHQIVQRGAAKVVLTIRDGDPVPGVTQELWRAGQFERLDLQPLPPDEATALLSATLGANLGSQTARRLWEMARGNVLYMRQVVEREVADGRLQEIDGCWQWTGDPVMPSGLVELIDARIGALTAAAGTVVDALAVGEPIDLVTLERIAGPDGVEEADARGLISLERVDHHIEVRMAHPLYGEARRRRAAPTRLRRLRGLVATELAASGDPGDIHVVIRRAVLSVDSDLAPDVGLLCRAAQGAVWLADLLLADQLAEAAARAGAGPEAHFLRAHALSWLGRGAEAEAVLADVPVARLAAAEHAQLAYLRASNVLWALADPAKAKHIIDDASRTAVGQDRSWVDALRTMYWFAMDRPDAAILAARELRLADLPPIVGTETAWVLAVMAADAGRVDDTVAIAETGYAVAMRCLDPPHMRFNVADAHLSALVLGGRIGEALDVAQGVREQAVGLPRAAALLGAAIAGRAALGAGNVDVAGTLLEEAAAGLSASGHAIGWGYRYHVPYAVTLALRGRTSEARATLDALDQVPRPFRSLDYERSIARAWVTASEGAITEAIAQLESAAERASGDGRFAAEVMCLQTAAQFGSHSGAPRLRELEGIVEGPRVGLAARLAGAMHGEHPDELVLLSEGFEQMGDLVAAMDAAAHAAVAYRRQDLRGSALSAMTRAEALSDRCGGADTPALRQALEPLPLTGRERELVMLLGDGLSNRDIAARLHLSVRTVEGHVYKAMAKTGTATREELAALLPRRVPQSH